MGIYKYWSWYNNNKTFSPGTIFHEMQKNQTNHVLALDANAIFHTAMQAMDDPVNAPMKDVGDAIWNEIMKITEVVKPVDALIIAVDGVPPAAKIQQQRQRRFLKENENLAKIQRNEKLGYDSNAINPGTAWMRDIIAHLQRKLLALQKGRQPAWWPKTISFSTDLTHGEGEHKIASDLRTMSATSARDHYKRIVIHGADSDLFLIFLNILDKTPNWRITLMRDSVNFRTKKMESKYINLQILYRNISETWNRSANPIQDFIFVLNFIGNDFLPHFVLLENVAVGLDLLIDAYTQFLKGYPVYERKNFIPRSDILGDMDHPTFIFDDGHVNWAYFREFMLFFKEGYENELMNSLLVTGQNKRAMFVDDINFYRNNMENTEDFRSLVYAYAATFPRIGADSRYRYDAIKDRSFRISQNDRMLNIWRQSSNLYDSTFVDNSNKSYLQMMLWTYNYYMKGAEGVNVDLFYPYIYSPYLFDLAEYVATEDNIMDIENPVIYQRGSWLSPIEQMLCVMPVSSHDLIPHDYRQVTRLLAWMYPRNFGTDVNMKQADFMSYTLLEPANLDIVRRILSKYIQLAYSHHGIKLNHRQKEENQLYLVTTRRIKPTEDE